jgi:hypothetical protein
MEGRHRIRSMSHQEQEQPRTSSGAGLTLLHRRRDDEHEAVGGSVATLQGRRYGHRGHNWRRRQLP